MARIISKWLDGGGDEWWEIEGEGYRLAGRSSTSSMSGWTRSEVAARFGTLTPMTDSKETS